MCGVEKEEEGGMKGAETGAAAAAVAAVVVEGDTADQRAVDKHHLRLEKRWIFRRSARAHPPLGSRACVSLPREAQTRKGGRTEKPSRRG